MKMTDQKDPKLTPKEAAELLGVHVDCLYRWRRRGGGPRYYRRMGRIFYLRSDVESWEFSNPGN